MQKHPTADELVVELVSWIKTEAESARRKLATINAIRPETDFLSAFLEGEASELTGLITKLDDMTEMYAEFVCSLCGEFNDHPDVDDPGICVDCYDASLSAVR